MAETVHKAPQNLPSAWGRTSSSPSKAPTEATVAVLRQVLSTEKTTPETRDRTHLFVLTLKQASIPVLEPTTAGQQVSVWEASWRDLPGAHPAKHMLREVKEWFSL